MKLKIEELKDVRDIHVQISNNNVSEDEVIEHTRKLYKQVTKWKWLKKLFGRWEEPQNIIMTESGSVKLTQDELESNIRDKTQIGIYALEALKFNIYWGQEID